MREGERSVMLKFTLCAKIAAVVLGLAAGLVAGASPVLNWSSSVEMVLPAGGGGRDTVTVRAETASFDLGSHQRLKRLFWKEGRAGWIGPEIDKYCVMNGEILGLEIMGRFLCLRRGVRDVENEGEFVPASKQALEALTSDVQQVTLRGDVVMDLSHAVGTPTLIGRSSRPHPKEATIVGISFVESDLRVDLRADTGRTFSVFFDTDLVPWKVTMGGADVLLLTPCAVDGRRSDRRELMWGPPIPKPIFAEHGPSEGVARHSSGAQKVESGRPSHMLVLSEDGRVWLGPPHTDLVSVEGGVVGFELQPDGDLVAIKSVKRVPLVRESVRVFQDWLRKAETELTARLAEAQVLVNLSTIPGGRIDGTMSGTGGIEASYVGGSIVVRFGSSPPAGRFLVTLAPDLAVRAAEFQAAPVADPNDRAFRD